MPDSLKIVPVRRRATRKQLQLFSHIWVDQAETQVVATTPDEKLAAMFGSYRSYCRDSQADKWEFEVVFDETSVSNARWVLGHRA